MGTNHFIFIQELPPEQNIETQGHSIIQIKTCIKKYCCKTPIPEVHRNTEIATLRHV